MGFIFSTSRQKIIEIDNDIMELKAKIRSLENQKYHAVKNHYLGFLGYKMMRMKKGNTNVGV